MDLSLFYFIHGFAGLSAWGDALIVFFATYYLYVVLAVFLYALWRDYTKSHHAASAIKYVIALVAGVVGRLGVAEIIRHFYHHERPFVVIVGLSHLITDSAYSFPSGHTIFIFSIAAAVHFFNKKLAYFMYVSGLGIGIARIAAGVHYPSDIAGGIVLGVSTGVIVYLVATKVIYILHSPRQTQL